jgi:mRNA interferase MazF
MNIAPGQGREQHGRSPVLIVSDGRLAALGLVLAVPLTTTDRGWEFHVPVDAAGQRSLAMCEQVRSVSVERLAGRLGSVPHSDLAAVRSMVRTLIGH